MTEELLAQQAKSVETARNARMRLDTAQESGRWIAFTFHKNADGSVSCGWDATHFKCDDHQQVLEYVAAELARLRAECPCCRAKRDAAQAETLSV